MTRRRSEISALRGFLYALARFLGDIGALMRGPKAIARRLERRGAGKVTGRMLGKMFKGE